MELDLTACLTGDAFLFSGDFLATLFDRDFAVFSFLAFAGVLDLAVCLATLFLETLALVWLFATEALRAEGLTAAALETTDLAGEAFLTEGFLAEGWAVFTVDAGFLTTDFLGEGDLAATLFFGEDFAGEGELLRGDGELFLGDGALFLGDGDFFLGDGELLRGEAALFFAELLAGDAGLDGLLFAGEDFLDDFAGDLIDLFGEDFFGVTSIISISSFLWD